MTTTRNGNGNTVSCVLHVAFELGQDRWKLAFTTGLGQKSRFRNVTARDRAAVLHEIARAKKRFQLPEDAPVVSCYEAGRDGAWLHRWLLSVGVRNHIIDSSSIEVNRKLRRAKNDALDADALVRLLVRYELGEKKAFRVVFVPSEFEEDQRQLHRELTSLKDERTMLNNQMKGHLCSQGVTLAKVDKNFVAWLDEQRLWNGRPVSAELQARLCRIFERWQKVHEQITKLETEQRRRVRTDSTPDVDKIRQLLQLKGLGVCGAWTFFREIGWRRGLSSKKVGALLGLVPTPYSSCSSQRELGISKAGNKHLRRLLVELAWCWLRHQPNSAISLWFQRRFREGPRHRRIGIVAVARKLAVALWRYLERGEVPPGAELVTWQSKMKGAKQISSAASSAA